MDPLLYLFVMNLEERGLCDVMSVRIGPTWRNKSVGSNNISMGIDRFLVLYGFLNDLLRINKWVGIGGDYDHFLIFLEVDARGENLSSSLKLND